MNFTMITKESFQPKAIVLLLFCFHFICLHLTAAVSLEKLPARLNENNFQSNGAFELPVLSVNNGISQQSQFDSNSLINDSSSNDAFTEHSRKQENIRERRSSTHTCILPTSCERDSKRFCPYRSGNSTDNECGERRALAPWHIWLDNGTERICCSCRKCLRPSDRTKYIFHYSVHPILVNNEIVGCFCRRN